jgi:hypothetical protein
MKNLHVIKKQHVEKWTIWHPVLFLVRKRDTSLKNGAIPSKTGRLVTLE